MENIIEGLTWSNLAIYYCIGLFGMAFSMLLQYVHHAEPISAYGGFKWATWFKENWPRVVLNLFGILAGVLFAEQLLGISLSAYSAFLSGWATDDVIDSLLNKKKKKDA